MKRALGLAAVSTFMACSGGCPFGERTVNDAGVVDAGPVELTEREPNDRPEQALPITGSSVVKANLGADPAKPDEDWYQLTSSTPQSVDLALGAIIGGDVALEVLDADRNRLALVNSEGVDKPERFPNLAVSARLLYLRVHGAKKGAGGAYSLTALYGPTVSGFEVEPNDRAVDATPVALGDLESGYVGHSADEDWYRYELPGAARPDGATAPTSETDGGVVAEPDAGDQDGSDVPRVALKLDLSGVDGVRYELSVLSEAEAPLFQVKGKDNEGLSLRNVGVRATDQVIYVVVKSAWVGTGKDAHRGYNPKTAYTLSVGQEEAGANAELEPNDELARATVLPLNGFREGFLSPKGDIDYFVLRTATPLLAKVALSGVDRLDLMVSMVRPGDDGSEQVLLKANDGAVKEPELLNNVQCVGECWLKVEGAPRKVDGKWVRDYENTDAPYRLTLTSVPDDGSQEREPNNGAETGTPIALGKSVRGTIHPKKDADFYRLDLSGRPVKTPLKASLTGILKVDLGLYLYRVGEDGKATLEQTSDKARGDAPEVIRYTAEPGTYVFEVRDSKNRDANFQDEYQLTVEEAGE